MAQESEKPAGFGGRLAALLAAIITPVVVYWATEGWPSGKQPSPTEPPYAQANPGPWQPPTATPVQAPYAPAARPALMAPRYDPSKPIRAERCCFTGGRFGTDWCGSWMLEPQVYGRSSLTTSYSELNTECYCRGVQSPGFVIPNCQG